MDSELQPFLRRLMVQNSGPSEDPNVPLLHLNLPSDSRNGEIRWLSSWTVGVSKSESWSRAPDLMIY